MVKNDFEELVIQIGCPHHMNFSPDRYHSHCFVWFDKYARMHNINIQKYTDLIKLGNELIAEEVTQQIMIWNN